MCELKDGIFFPPAEEYLKWVMSKPSNRDPKLQIGTLKTSPSRFGLTPPQMTPFLKILQGLGMFFETKGLVGGGKQEASKNLGCVLDQKQYPDFGGLICLGFNEIATVAIGETSVNLERLHPIVDRVVARVRQQLLTDDVLQNAFPGIGELLKSPIFPLKPETAVSLAKTLFDPRPFMRTSAITASSETASEGYNTVEYLERISRVSTRLNTGGKQLI